MQMVSEVMTRNVRFVSPQESLQRAAQMMDELNVGALPVCDGDRLIGMVTDRDITVRATAAGRAPGEAHVEEVMSTDVRWCFEDQDLDEVMQQMADTQIRRVPVVTHDDAHRLVGIVSLGDVATKTTGGAQKQSVEQTMEKVSSPSEPDLSQPGRAADASNAPNARAGLGVGPATGSDTGTATGLAGSDTITALRGDASSTDDASQGAAGTTSATTGATAGKTAGAGSGRGTPAAVGGDADTAVSGQHVGMDAGGPRPGIAGAGGRNDLGDAAAAADTVGTAGVRTAGTSSPSPGGAAGSAGETNAQRDADAIGRGTSAIGPSGPSGGVSGSGGAGGASVTGKKR